MKVVHVELPSQFKIMKTLTENQKLRITRIGRCLSLEKIAKEISLSISFVSLMESDDRKVPDFVEDILNFDQGIKWYQTILEVLLNSNCCKEDINEAIQTLNRILRIK